MMVEATKPEINVVNLDGDPGEWAGNELSQFLAAGWRNTVRSFAAEAERFRTLSEIDGVFRTLVSDAGVNSDRVAAAFLVRTHGDYLAAASLALSGQAAQAYSLMRTTLETLLQGLHISTDSERKQLWLARHDDDAAQSRAKSMTSFEASLAHLRQLDSATAAIIDTLHARVLDRSGHPNTYANLSRPASAESAAADLKREYFVCDDDVQRGCLRSAAQVGICALTTFYYVFAERYRELQLGERINKLRQGH